MINAGGCVKIFHDAGVVADRRLYEAKAAGRNRVVGGEKGMRLVHAG
jgi:hypothetical protein